MFRSDSTKGFSVYPDTNEVSIGNQKVKLTPKEMGVLEILMERRESTVSRTELLERVWGNQFANDQGLTQAISRLRGIFLLNENLTIKTIPKKGYQLQSKELEQSTSVLSWIKSHALALILLLLAAVIGVLIFVQPIGIRIQKTRIIDQNNAQSQ